MAVLIPPPRKVKGIHMLHIVTQWYVIKVEYTILTYNLSTPNLMCFKCAANSFRDVWGSAVHLYQLCGRFGHQLHHDLVPKSHQCHKYAGADQCQQETWCWKGLITFIHEYWITLIFFENVLWLHSSPNFAAMTTESMWLFLILVNQIAGDWDVTSSWTGKQFAPLKMMASPKMRCFPRKCWKFCWKKRTNTIQHHPNHQPQVYPVSCPGSSSFSLKRSSFILRSKLPPHNWLVPSSPFWVATWFLRLGVVHPYVIVYLNVICLVFI